MQASPVSEGIASSARIHLPGLDAPEPVGSLLMAVAGVAWGFYSLRGRGSGDPLAETAGNFIRSVPMVALVSLLSLSSFQITVAGGTC